MLKNSPDRFGAVSKFFHWSVFALFVYQYLGANIMTRLGRSGTVLGMDANFFYNWHKSLGLVILALVIARLIWRRTTKLPDWHEPLSDSERRITHRIETFMYWLMFALPVSGYLFVMAGGYGVKLFGITDLSNPIGKQDWAWIAWTAHVVLAYAAFMFISWHIGLIIKKQIFDRSEILRRMLPFRR